MEAKATIQKNLLHSQKIATKNNTMKKLLLLLLIAPVLGFGQTPFNINSNNELTWSKVYDSHIDIESQLINLSNQKSGVAIYIRDIHSADLVVHHKDDKTRLLVKNIKSFTSLDDEPSLINKTVINTNKGEYRKFFLKRDSKVLNEIIERAVNSIIDESSW